MVQKTTARLHLLPAKEAPVVAVIRRKPSKCFHVMRWDTQADQVEHGSWFRGKLYPMRCDVSFDGEWMVYLALGVDGNTWSGLCRLPRLKTVCDAPNGGTYHGGGYWAARKTLLLNGWDCDEYHANLPFRTETYRSFYGEDEGVLYPRLLRDGWRRAGPLGKEREVETAKKYMVICENDPGWFWRPTPRHPMLRAFYRGYLDHGRTFEFALDEFPALLDRDVEWATWDAVGQLVAARGGCLAKYAGADLASGNPSFHLCLEDLQPPTGQRAEEGREQ
jgi:hypothetical protein